MLPGKTTNGGINKTKIGLKNAKCFINRYNVFPPNRVEGYIGNYGFGKYENMRSQT